MTANSITVTSLAIITAAMQEIGALAPGETPSNEDQAWVLQKLQRLIDRYNARLPMIYNINFSTFTLQANHSPHTIGPGADFDVNQRPVSIVTIGLVLPGGVEIPINVRDQDWWANNRIKGLTSTLPTDAFYSPDWPIGQIYFWPIPKVAYQVIVQSRLVLTEVSDYVTSFSMPPAYWDAIVYELAISIGPSFEREAGATLIGLWKAAIKAVQVNNVASPRLSSDAPSQTSGGGRSDFSFLTGMTR